MSDQLDLEELARRYLDLWQEQATALAADPNFAAALKDLYAGGEAAARLGDAVAAWGAMLPPGLFPGGLPPRHPDDSQGGSDDQAADGRAEREASTARRGAKPPGPPAPGAASHDGGHDLDEFARRLAALEERIAALESGARGKGRGAARKPRKRGS
jgi:hypothetical protein